VAKSSGDKPRRGRGSRWDWAALKAAYFAHRTGGERLTLREFCLARAREAGRPPMSIASIDKRTAGWARDYDAYAERLAAKVTDRTAERVARQSAAVVEIDQLATRVRLLKLADPLEELVGQILSVGQQHLKLLLAKEPGERNHDHVLKLVSVLPRASRALLECLIRGAGLPTVHQVQTEAAQSELAANRVQQRELQRKAESIREWYKQKHGVELGDDAGEQPLN
jgi:hypothetical protein